MRLLSSISREAPVLLAGPTASGKSALAMDLAARDGRLVVNADALQVWSCWRVVTARPSPADEQAAPHALYGHMTPGAAYSVGHWLAQVVPLLHRPVVIVGGTMLYFRALTRGLAEIPAIPAKVRVEADALRQSGDLPTMLAALDPLTLSRIDRQNPMRVQRAWEVWRTTGRGLAAWQDTPTAPLIPLAGAEPLILTPDRPWLRDRIARRFGQMLEQGALDEVRAMLPAWTPDAPWARAIGAPELAAHLRSELTADQATAAAITATQQYAKRQDTAFRGLGDGWRRAAPD